MHPGRITITRRSPSAPRHTRISAETDCTLGFSIDEMRELLAVIHDLADPASDAARKFELGQQLAAFTENARERRQGLRTQLAMADEFVERLETLSVGRRPPAQL